MKAVCYRWSYCGAIVLGLFTLVLFAGPAEAINLRDWGDQTPDAKVRFEVLKEFTNEAVLDKETQLVWERKPATIGIDWPTARLRCADLAVGGRKGWKLPSFDQLASLLDAKRTNLALPPSHPFSAVQPSEYWSATADVGKPTKAWIVDLDKGTVSVDDKADQHFAWCVRGGQSGPHAY